MGNRIAKPLAPRTAGGLYTVREAAEWLQVTPSTVYALCRARKLAHERVGLHRGVIRIAESDLTEFRSLCRVEARSEVDLVTIPKRTPLPRSGKPNLRHF
jgi:excisionase family DNA binding protein